MKILETVLKSPDSTLSNHICQISEHFFSYSLYSLEKKTRIGNFDLYLTRIWWIGRWKVKFLNAHNISHDILMKILETVLESPDSTLLNHVCQVSEHVFSYSLYWLDIKAKIGNFDRYRRYWSIEGKMFNCALKFARHFNENTWNNS